MFILDSPHKHSYGPRLLSCCHTTSFINMGWMMANSGRFVGFLALAGVVIACGAWLFPDIRDIIFPPEPSTSTTPADQSRSTKQSGGQPTRGGPEWSCPGGTFCAWDGPDGTGTMVAQKDSACRLHDIGSAGVGDRVTSFQNRTGKPVGLYNWTGQKWDLLVRIADGQAGNMPAAVDNITDAINVCDP